MDYLIIENKTYCLNCGEETDCTKYCDEHCRSQYRNKQAHPVRLCACGCGKPVTGRSKYFEQQCGRRAWARQWRNKNRERYNAYQRKYRNPGTTEPKQIELIPGKKAAGCGCGDYAHCMACRNAEKRDAFKHGRIPAYRLQTLAALAGD